MTYQFALSPDVNLRDLSHWFVLNTRLQKLVGEPIHLAAFDDFAELHRAIDSDAVDLIFANAGDTALLLRERGYLPLASPAGVADEALIAVAADGPLGGPGDLRGLQRIANGQPLSVAATDAPDVERICRILLEPVDLLGDAIVIAKKRNPVLVAKAIVNGEAQAGFFLAAAFHELSAATRNLLQPIAESRIYVVRHSLLLHPRAAGLAPALLAGLARLGENEADRQLLRDLGAPDGWAPLSREEADLMVDLMDTLKE